MTKSIAELLEERKIKAENGPWYPANGGTEPVFTARSGRRLQYCYQPTTGRHAYYDVDNDIILSDDDAQTFLL